MVCLLSISSSSREDGSFGSIKFCSCPVLDVQFQFMRSPSRKSNILNTCFHLKSENGLLCIRALPILCLYSNTSPIRLPVKSLTSIFKASKVSGLLQLRDSKDSSVRLLCPRLETGSSWNIREEVSTECDPGSRGNGDQTRTR